MTLPLAVSPVCAIVWDLDGTLVDTVDLVFAATRYAVERCRPGAVSDEELWELFGRPVTEVWPALAPHPDCVPQLDLDFQEFYAQHRAELVKPVPGVLETLDRLRALGVRMAVLSNKRRSQGEEELAAAHLDVYFDTLLWADDLPRAKPEPDGLWLALERLGAPVAAALMVGDGEMDILCAKKAGVPAVAAVWASWARRKRALLESLAPEYVAEDIREVLRLVRPE